MKVLIAPNFNKVMEKLPISVKREVSEIYRLVMSLSRDEFVQSPLLTRLDAADGIYTIRTLSARLFCSFVDDKTVLFLDVKEVSEQLPYSSAKRDKEVTLFSGKGVPQAYIATDDDDTVYTFDGRPLAYVDGSGNLYGFNGMHLGWFEDGVVWDHKGRRVGFTEKTCPVFRRFEPFKGFKRFKPFKAFKRFAPFKPVKSFINSNSDLLEFLQKTR
jgi:hypothetical protein